MSDPHTVAGGGLRERSKAKRRAALQLAALRLFAERGYDNTTLADIAEAAEVAPRTIAGYFASKAELATSVGDDIVARLIRAYQDQPELGYLDVIDRWLVQEEELADGQVARLAEAMYRKNPALRAVDSARSAEANELAQPLLAAALQLAPDHPMFAIARTAVGAAIGAYLARIAEYPQHPQLHQAFMSYLRSLVANAREVARPIS